MSKFESDKIKGDIENLFNFCGDILDWLNAKGIKLSIGVTEINIAVLALKAIDSDYLANQLIDRSYPYWNSIRLKEEKFLLEKSDVIFGELPESYRKDICNLFTMKDSTGDYILPDESREDFWLMLGDAVKGMIKYVHQNRCPVYEGDNVSYTVKFYNNIKLKEEMKLWNM